MEDIEKKKMQEEDARVTKLNDESYKDDQIKDIRVDREKMKDPRNAVKEKIVEHVTYRNGVVKSRLTGLYKDGRLLYSGASKKSDKRKGK
jgi:hypothetical protein